MGGAPPGKPIFFPIYNIQKDKPWLDSIKQIVRKGFVQDVYQKNNWKKQRVFVNSCVELGMYYEKLFEKKELPNMKLALYYYIKVADMGRFPDDEKYFKALAIRTTLFRKLSAIYFKGKGVKKDNALSRYYALEGIANNPRLFPFYSKRFFGCNCIILSSDQMTNADTVFSLIINPFAERLNLFSTKLIDTSLLKIANNYKSNKDTSLGILIEAFAEPSSRAQHKAQTALNNITKFLIHKAGINDNLIYTNLYVDQEKKKYIVVRFVQKDFIR